MVARESRDQFAGTVLGFVASALLVLFIALPLPPTPERRGIYDRTTRGQRIYLATSRLRGLLAVSAAIAAAGSMVFVSTVVLVQAHWGLPQNALALARDAFGAGSMLAALGLPRLLNCWSDRQVMFVGVMLLGGAMLVGSQIWGYAGLLPLWFIVGLGCSAAQTPSGRLLRRSPQSVDRPALFAAQFALTHACWLVFHPLAGWAGSRWDPSATFVLLGGAAALAGLGAAWLWPQEDPDALVHEHVELPPDHPHLRKNAEGAHGTRHAHPFWIDDQHKHWPRS